jgi:hypothetical protein
MADADESDRVAGTGATGPDRFRQAAELRAELEGTRLTRAERASARQQLAALEGLDGDAEDPPSVRGADRTARRNRAAPEGEQGLQINPNLKRDVTALIASLAEKIGAVAEHDQPLADRLRQLEESAGRRGQVNTIQLRTRLAHAVEDVEKLVGSVPMGETLRRELQGLAGTVPGLSNARAVELLRSTPKIENAALVQDIRRVAAGIALLSDQDTAEVGSRLDALENRIRLSEAPAAPSARREAASPESVARQAAPVDSAAALAARFREFAQESPAGLRARSLDPQSFERAGAPPVAAAAVNPLIALMRHVAGERESREQAPPGRQASLADRLAAFERDRAAPRQQTETLGAGERAGRTALDALRSFASGPGEAVLTRIQDAAKATPGGIAAVLSEMKDGGRFADLRQEFNAALVSERGFKAAYDRATGALAEYGRLREGAEAILGQRNDLAAVAGRFERIDAELGQAAESLPGRRDGKSALGEISDKAREIIEKAIEGARNLFGAAPRAASSGASPG